MRVTLGIVVIILLAGCAGEGSQAVPSGAEVVSSNSDDAVGAVSGTVVDDERRPLIDVTVRLDPAQRSTKTNGEGRFVFARVPVGVYALNASVSGYHSSELRVNITEGRTETALVTLVALPSAVAYYETFPYAGVQSCMIYTSVYLASCSQPYTAVYYTALGAGVNLSQFGLPTDPIDNKYRASFEVRENYTGLVSELAWTAATDASRYYKLVLSCPWYDPVIDDCVPPGETGPTNEATYAVARGVSPLRIELNPKDIRADWLPTIMVRAYLSGPVERPAGAALDQRIEMYNSVFYGLDVPRDWTIFTAS
ncbi:MAG TPA: carboxypeptidase-like regulatory domain-containing protein [Candidatus Thermoplasmatota archaeon]